MKLRYVTFTGADDTTSIEDLVELSREYPKVEWGVLLSENSMGNKARFPCRSWMDNLAAYLDLRGVPVNLSGHLCGTWMRRIVSMGVTQDAAHGVGPLWTHFQRLQINFAGSENIVTPFMDKAFLDVVDKRWILQNRNHGWVAPTIQRYGDKRLHVLGDHSGGRGVLPQSWTPQFMSEVEMYGYAGGLSPENIGEQIELIAKVSEGREFWIDMESGIRTSEKFDLKKVQAVLEILKPYL